jgi:ATP-dependent DNA ligase
LTLGSSSKERNKRYFKRLVNHKTEIENRFGGQLVWEELPNNKMSRIKIEINHVNLFNEDDWDEMDNFFIENLPKFEEAFKNYLGQLT